MFFQADKFRHGRGVAQNDCKACDLLAAAASLGDAEATYQFARMVERGFTCAEPGTARRLPAGSTDHKLAWRLYLQAADMGHYRALWKVSECYAVGGPMTAVDMDKCRDYFLRAAKGANARCKCLSWVS
jgi:TPR repeat protein